MGQSLRWGGQGAYNRDQKPLEAVEILKNDYLAVRRHHLFVRHSIDNVDQYDIPGSYSALLPNSQANDITINFGSYDCKSVSENQDQEYIELVNPNDSAVDISGWKLSGSIKFTFKPGTVIIAGASLFVSPNMSIFKQRTVSPMPGEGLFVQGNYKGYMSDSGGIIELKNSSGDFVNTLSY